MGLASFEHVLVRGLCAVVPAQCRNIDDELEFYDNDMALLERNKAILGLGTRHVADDRTGNSDLCGAAAEKLFENMKIDRSGIDCLICASTSHDYHYPASACVLHGRLGLNEDCSCFDVGGLGCTAYVHGLWLAHSLIASGAAKRCLLVAGEIASRHSHPRNRNSNMLFGDAGTATLLEHCEAANPAWFLTGTRGVGWDKLIAPAGGYDLPVEKDIAGLEIDAGDGNIWRLTDDIMRGFDIFKFSTEVGPAGIARLLKFAGKDVEDVDYFALHQANGQIVRAVGRHARLPEDKYSSKTFSAYGNASAAAVTLDVCRELSAHPKKFVCLATFGVGLSWGFAILNWREAKVYPIGFYETPANKMTRDEKIRYWIDYYKAGLHA